MSKTNHILDVTHIFAIYILDIFYILAIGYLYIKTSDPIYALCLVLLVCKDSVCKEIRDKEIPKPEFRVEGNVNFESNSKMHIGKGRVN
jgi:hypothetical protein